MKKITEISGKQGSVGVYRDNDWDQYVVIPRNGSGCEGWYYTNERQDALGTAKAISDNPRYFN